MPHFEQSNQTSLEEKPLDLYAQNTQQMVCSCLLVRRWPIVFDDT